MSKHNDGGPAFPMPISNGGYSIIQGMSLRDYFAAKAMQAMVSSYRNCNRGDCDGDSSGIDMYTPARDLLIDKNGVTGENDGAIEIAADSYAIADAMLAERAKGAAQ